MAKIFASDLNTIRTKVTDVLGSGSASFGYGQTVYSSAVTSGQVIREDQWDAVRFDILNTYVHQTGNIPSAIDVSIGDTIEDDAGGAYKNYEYFADLLRNNRFDIATGQFDIKQEGDVDAARLAGTTKNTSSTWSNNASAELNVTFNSATEARHFFNAGGAIRIITTLTGGTTQQAGAWTTLLNNQNPVDFEGDIIAATGFYTLTNSYQTYFSRAASTPYSANLYQLKAKSDVANNSAGTATQVDIKIELIDNYVDLGPPNPPIDLVDGTLQIEVNEKLPVGILKPTNTAWAEYPPNSYTMSAITVS